MYVQPGLDDMLNLNCCFLYRNIFLVKLIVERSNLRNLKLLLNTFLCEVNFKSHGKQLFL